MAIRRFVVEIGDKFTMINSNSNINVIDFLSRTHMRKLQVENFLVAPKSHQVLFLSPTVQMNF